MEEEKKTFEVDAILSLEGWKEKRKQSCPVLT